MYRYIAGVLCVFMSVFCGVYVHANVHDSTHGNTHGNMQDKKAQRPVIVVMGDSLSAAYQIPERDGWVALLAARLKTQGYDYRVVNGSVSGATTQAGLQRLPPLLKRYVPSVVLLELGANDGLQGLPIANITHNLASLITQSQGVGAEVALLGIRLPPNLGSRYNTPFFNQFAELARTHNVAYLPFLLDGVAGVDNNKYMQADGLHPNVQGQPIILDNVWPILKPLLQK